MGVNVESTILDDNAEGDKNSGGGRHYRLILAKKVADFMPL